MAGERDEETPAAAAGDDLDAVLQRFESSNERRPVGADQIERESQLAFVKEFESAREERFRTALEQTAWRLEQRGHHAWIEEPAVDTALQGELALSEYVNPDDRPTLTAIELRVLPVGDMRVASRAPALRFAPDPGAGVVQVSMIGTDPDDPSEHVLGRARIDELSFDRISHLATQLVEEVFLRHRRVLDDGVPSERTGVAGDVGDWSPELGGIIPRLGESRDWT